MGVLGLKTSSLQGLGGALRFRVSPQSQLPVAKGIKLRVEVLVCGFSWDSGHAGAFLLFLEWERFLVVCLCWGFGVSYST